VQFITQYVQAGLKGQIPLYQVFTIDELALPRLKDLAIGVRIRGISLEKGTAHGISSFSVKTRGRDSCTSPGRLGI